MQEDPGKTMQDEIRISLHKSRLVMMLLGALVFVGVGTLILVLAVTQAAPLRVPQVFITVFFGILGLVSVGFFGWCVLAMAARLFSRKPGLILNNEGFWDHSSGISAGFISWADVTAIETRRVEFQRFIVIHLSNPRDLIRRQGFTARFWMRLNDRIYGTPVWISANFLHTSFDQLHEQIVTRYYEYRRQNAAQNI